MWHLSPLSPLLEKMNKLNTIINNQSLTSGYAVVSQSVYKTKVFLEYESSRTMFTMFCTVQLGYKSMFKLWNDN